jgi:hypothetical protein
LLSPFEHVAWAPCAFWQLVDGLANGFCVPLETDPDGAAAGSATSVDTSAGWLGSLAPVKVTSTVRRL